MRILRNYVLQEHISPFFVTLAGLTTMLLIGNLVKFAELVIARGVSIFDLLRLLIYLTPYLLSFTVPMACLIAMVLAFGRLGMDYELIALRASGISPTRLIAPVAMMGLVISLTLMVLNDRVIPSSHLAFRRQLKAIGIKQPIAYLEAGTFIKEFEPYIIYVYRIRGKSLHDVRIYEPQANGPTRTIIATRGEFLQLPDKRGVQLKLFTGTADEWNAQNPGAFYKVAFSTYTMNLRADQTDPERIGKKLKEMAFGELVKENAKLKALGIDAVPVSLELHRKIASAFAPFVFAMFGLAFGLRLRHQERLTIYVWILVIFIGYYLGTIAMNAVARKGSMDPALAMWLPNAVGLLIGGGFLTASARR